MPISTTDLMLNPDGSVYHLHAFPEDIAPTVILVGNPRRVDTLTQHFDVIEVKKFFREFVVQTGRLNNKRITVIGTGISTANIDIVINELDILVNVNLKTKEPKKKLTSLNIIRLGTSGAIQKDIPVNSLLLSTYAFSFDGLLNYYHYDYNDTELELLQTLHNHFADFPMHSNLYVSQGDERLIELFMPLCQTGITMTCCGFYGPQHRELRTPILHENIISSANHFKEKNQLITNLEMETAGIYGLGRLLGHQCCSISTIVANHITDEKIPNPEHAVEKMIEQVIEIIKNYL